jgi:hypothetical protein
VLTSSFGVWRCMSVSFVCRVSVPARAGTDSSLTIRRESGLNKMIWQQRESVLADLARDKSARACLPFGRRVAAPAQSGAGRLEIFVCCPTPFAQRPLALWATKPMNLAPQGPSDGFEVALGRSGYALFAPQGLAVRRDDNQIIYPNERLSQILTARRQHELTQPTIKIVNCIFVEICD